MSSQGDGLRPRAATPEGAEPDKLSRASLASTIAEALATFDASCLDCPARRSHLGARDCPKCGARACDGCHREVGAAYRFIDTIRKAQGEK